MKLWGSLCGRMFITLVNLLWNVINLWLHWLEILILQIQHIMNIQARKVVEIQFLESNGSLLKLFTSPFSLE